MKRMYALVFTTILSVMSVGSRDAAAHAALKSSLPLAGAVLAEAPKEIAITFNEAVEEAFSSITVSDVTGKPVAAGKSAVDAQNHLVLKAALPALASGKYAVHWVAVGPDGHRRKGDFSFTVK